MTPQEKAQEIIQSFAGHDNIAGSMAAKIAVELVIDAVDAFAYSGNMVDSFKGRIESYEYVADEWKQVLKCVEEHIERLKQEM